MANTFENLIESMLSEKAVYEELLALAGDKKEALVKNDINRIEEITKLEEGHAKKLKQLNGQSESALSDIAKELGIGESPNLSQILELTDDGDLREKLMDIQAQFQSLINDLCTENRINQKLVETQLQYTTFCIELMTQSQHIGDIYGSQGYVNEGTIDRKGLLDQEV